VTSRAAAREGARETRRRVGRAAGWLLVGAALLVLAGCGASEQAVEADLARGAELYERHCAACHGGATGGEISDIPPPHNAEGHTWHHATCDLVDITLEGLPPREGQPEMPAFEGRLTEEEVRTIITHIARWWEPDQRAHQAEVTEQMC
jgi:mono/diheme cytochrome c family protein